MNVAQAGSAIWLTDWSDNSNENMTDKYSRDLRIGIYGAIGLFQRKSKKIILQLKK